MSLINLQKKNLTCSTFSQEPLSLFLPKLGQSLLRKWWSKFANKYKRSCVLSWKYKWIVKIHWNSFKIFFYSNTLDRKAKTCVESSSDSADSNLLKSITGSSAFPTLGIDFFRSSNWYYSIHKIESMHKKYHLDYSELNKLNFFFKSSHLTSTTETLEW